MKASERPTRGWKVGVVGEEVVGEEVVLLQGVADGR